MAQLERYPRQVNASKSLSAAAASEKVLRGGEAIKGSSSTSLASSNPSFFSGNLYEKSRIHETFEEDLSPQKKSVLTKVKEKAKKLRHSLSSKKRHDDGNLTPTSGFIMEEEEEDEEDAEYLGAPMYESELAPEAYKENARQHPRATPVIAENHCLQHPLMRYNRMEAADREMPLFITNNHIANNADHFKRPNSSSSPTSSAIVTPPASNKTTIMNNTPNSVEKLTLPTTTHHHHHPHHHHNTTNTTTTTNKSSSSSSSSSQNSDTNNAAASSKIPGLTITKPSSDIINNLQSSTTPTSAPASILRRSPLSVTSPQTPPARSSSSSKASPVASSKAPRYPSAPTTPRNNNNKTFSSSASLKNSTSHHNGSVSVKEFFINKLEPGEDEKALSQVISEAMTPKRTPGDVGVMEKVREAVNSLLRNEDPSSQSSHYAVKTTTIRASPQVSAAVANNVQEVTQDENQGRILQQN